MERIRGRRSSRSRSTSTSRSSWICRQRGKRCTRRYPRLLETARGDRADRQRALLRFDRAFGGRRARCDAGRPARAARERAHCQAGVARRRDAGRNAARRARVRALLGLGANLGDPAATLREAKTRLDAIGRVTAVSSLYRTPPWGVADQPPFVNAALALETALDPDALLAALKALERALGRVASVRWGHARSTSTFSTTRACGATIRR